MALQIPAAVIAILTYLGRHTTRQAITKYGDDAVKGAMKYADKFKQSKNKKQTKADDEATNVRVQEAAKKSRQAAKRSKQKKEEQLDPASSGKGPLKTKELGQRISDVVVKLKDKNLTPKKRNALNRQLENLRRIRSEGRPDLMFTKGKLNKGGMIDYRKTGMFK
jgi:hypothetical protein